MISKIKSLAEKYKCGNFLFSSKTETFYLSGAAFDGFWILALNSTPHIICSKMIESQTRAHFGNQIKIYTQTPFSKTAARLIKDAGAKEIIIDAKYVSAADFLLLESRLKETGAALVSKSGVLDFLRIVKSADEIENIKTACKIVSEVCDIAKSELKPGISELDVYYRILELFARRKVKESFSPIVAAGANSANPHHASSNYKIKENDAVMMDLGCFYNGCASDLTRTYYLGKINEEFKKVWNIVKESQSAAISAVKAGEPLSLADKTARDIISNAGYKDNFIHTTGHGVGIEIHEMPSLANNAEGVFLTGMAVTIEPGIYIDGKFGVRIEDTVLIKEGSCEILTSAKYF